MGSAIERAPSGQSLSGNLSKIFKERGLVVSRVAGDLGFPVLTLRRILSGQTKNPGIITIQALSTYLGVSIDSLLGMPSFEAAAENPSEIRVPVYDLDSIKLDGGNLIPLNDESVEYRLLPRSFSGKVSKDIFSITSKPSMFPRFPSGSLLVFDPKEEVVDGDVVLIELLGLGDYALREILVDTPDKILRSISTASPDIIYSPDAHRIVGVNILTIICNDKE